MQMIFLIVMALLAVFCLLAMVVFTLVVSIRGEFRFYKREGMGDRQERADAGIDSRAGFDVLPLRDSNA